MKTISASKLILLIVGSLFCGILLSGHAQQSKADRKLFEEIKAKAEKGDAQSQYEMGGVFGLGNLGVAKDEAEAVKWFRRASNQNYAEARYILGVCYSDGYGVEKNDVESVKWFRKSADQNYATAQYSMGVSYTKGRGVAKDEVEAVEWYRKAAAQNYANAEFALGVCYANGRGVAKDDGEAIKWYKKAAEQNIAEAQLNLSIFYDTGKGVKKNSVEAIKWCRKAAEQNHAQAQSKLGGFFFEGDGVAKDYAQAYSWILLAAGQDFESAKQFVPVIEAMMTQEQIAEGQKLARKFKPRKAQESNVPFSRNEAESASPTVTGTGFFITEDGFLITNEHVVKDAVQIRLLTSAGIISAKIVKVDAANDVALLKAEGKFSPLPIAASRAVRLGNSVVTVGFPNIGLQGFAPKFARGEIAALSGAGDDARYFQISVPVQPGNSGGALVDERGNVVGVVSAKLNATAAFLSSGALPENVNYAVNW